MAWASEGEVLIALAAALHRTAGTPLTSNHSIYVNQGCERAKGEIRRALNVRGYTDAQVGAWADLHEFSYDLSLFFSEGYMREALKDGAGELMGFKDRRGELAGVYIATPPDDDPGTGGVTYGNFTDRDNFNAAVAGRTVAFDTDRFPYRR
jgi:hypothetical protein